MRENLLIMTAGVALMLGGCSAKKEEQPAVDPGMRYTTTNTIKDLMDSIVDPNADYLWGAVLITTTAKGEQNKAPHTDEEWKEVRRHAVTLVEATNLLLVPNRHVAKPGEKADDPEVEESPEAIEAHINGDRATFESRVQRLRAAATATLAAVDKKDAARMEEAGDDVDKACEACHLVYWYPKDKYAQQLFHENEEKK
jgi:hypothetical protein